MVELVTPCSVAPVACPLPQGDGSVPKVADEDEAPPVPGARSTPVAVREREQQSRPRSPRADDPCHGRPPVRTTRFLRLPPQNPDPVLCASAPYQSDIRKSRRPNTTVTACRGWDRRRCAAPERPRRRFADWSMTALARVLSVCSSAASRSRTARTCPTRDRSCWWPTTPTGSSTASCSGDPPPLPALLGQVDAVQHPALVAVPEAGGRHPGLPDDRRRGGGSQRVGLRHQPRVVAPAAGWWRCSPRGSATTSSTLQPLKTGAARIALETSGGRRSGGPGDGRRRTRLRRQGTVPLAGARPGRRAGGSGAVGRGLSA